jgi:citrate synthase
MAMNARSAIKAIRALKVCGNSNHYARKHDLTFTQPVVFRPITASPNRSYATSSEPDLKTTFKECIPAKLELLKKVKAHSGKVIGEVKIENTLGGMR